MTNRVYITVGVLAMCVAIGLLLHRQKNPAVITQSQSNSTNVIVAATFYPLAYFAEQVGGAQITVVNATPAGVEPHDYEPSPRELAKVGEADILLINGAGLDPWAEKASVDWQKNGQHVLVMSEIVETLPTTGNHDPHFWLDPVRARQMIGMIRDALIEVDPIRADVYRQNAMGAVERMSKLDQDYKTGLANCEQREIMAAHDAYNYLANRYNLELYAIAGLSPEAEPSARRLAELTDLVKTKGISTIFFETLTSRQLADTLAREAGIKTAVLNPIEGLTAAEVSAGKNYDILMRENLAQLRFALVCQ